MLQAKRYNPNIITSTTNFYRGIPVSDHYFQLHVKSLFPNGTDKQNYLTKEL